MNNSTITSADRATHLKIVVVSLLAAIVVVVVGLAARPDFTSRTGFGSGRLEATGPVIKAGKPMAMTGRDGTTIR
jgi:hypothetical protein